MTNKLTHKEKVQIELNHLEQEINRLKAKANANRAQAHIEYARQMKSLNEKKAQLEGELQALKSATSDAWDDIKSGADNAWEDIKTTARKVRGHYS